MIIRNDKKINRKTAVCLGFFDGVHLGHQSLINQIKQLSKDDIKTLIYTFDRHALAVSGKEIKLITPFERKLEILKSQHTDYIYIQHMDKGFMNILPEDFVKNILHDTLNAKYVVVGKNYCFGKSKAGNADFLIHECVKYGIECHVLPYVKIDGNTISSSNIRRFIADGNIKKANEYMGRAFAVVGEVIMGRQDGRKIGFPTANIIPQDNTVLPPNGVYATQTYIGNKIYKSITNVGKAPTFGGTKTVVETNIFDFNKDIYGKTIRVDFLDRLRVEEKFSSIENLVKQIKVDVINRNKY